MASETPCVNCGKSVPDGAELCPNCGAGIIPLPVLDGGKRVAGAPAPNAAFWTGSRQGDVATGIALGVVLPPLFVGIALTPCLLPVWGSSFGIVFLLLVPVIFGGLIYSTNRIIGKYPPMCNALQKTLWAWLIAVGLGFIGLVTGLIKI